VLHEAICKEHSIDTVKILLDHDNMLVESRNKLGQTALHTIVEKVATRAHDVPESAFQVFNFLLKRGADPHTADTEGWTALQSAVLGNKKFGCYGRETHGIHFARRLLENGADQCVRNEKGDTVLIATIRQRHHAGWTGMLLANSSKCAGMKDAEGFLPIHVAVLRDSPLDTVFALMQCHPGALLELYRRDPDFDELRALRRQIQRKDKVIDQKDKVIVSLQLAQHQNRKRKNDTLEE
jgi:hypothetical protein